MSEFGTLYVKGGSTGQQLSTSYQKMTGWATRGDSSYYVDGLFGIRADLTQDRFSLLAGKYLVMVSISASIDAADVQITAGLHLDGVEEADGICVCESEESGKVDLVFNISTIINPTSPKALDVRLKAETGTPTITPTNAHFTVVKLD